VDDGVEMIRQMMEEICLYRLCERDVSADNGVALDGWGTGLSPDDGDRLLSPNKESAFCKRSKREKNQYHQQQQRQQNFGKKEQQQHQQSWHDNESTKNMQKMCFQLMPKNLPSKRKIQSMQSVPKSLYSTRNSSVF